MLDLLKSRRSIRKYTQKEVEQEKIESILKAGLLAPSSRGKRPCEFIVVKDKGLLQKLSVSKPTGSTFIANASVAIVVIADAELTDMWVEDASIAATLMQLEAHKLGLGSCWSQVRGRVFDDNKGTEQFIKELLNIPEKFGVCCVLAIGYPDEKKSAYQESDIDLSKVHIEKFW